MLVHKLVFRLHLRIFQINDTFNVVKVWTLEQMPIILIEDQVLLHPFDRNCQSLDYFLGHRFVHGTEVLFHFVEHSNMLAIADVLGLLCLILKSVFDHSTCGT